MIRFWEIDRLDLSYEQKLATIINLYKNNLIKTNLDDFSLLIEEYKQFYSGLHLGELNNTQNKFSRIIHILEEIEDDGVSAEMKYYYRSFSTDILIVEIPNDYITYEITTVLAERTTQENYHNIVNSLISTDNEFLINEFFLRLFRAHFKNKNRIFSIPVLIGYLDKVNLKLGKLNISNFYGIIQDALTYGSDEDISFFSGKIQLLLCRQRIWLLQTIYYNEGIEHARRISKFLLGGLNFTLTMEELGELRLAEAIPKIIFEYFTT